MNSPNLTSASDLRELYRRVAPHCSLESHDPLEVAVARSASRARELAFDMASKLKSCDSEFRVNSSVNTILLKPVGDMCNMACSYCYERERLQLNPLKKMRVSTLRNIVRNMAGSGSQVQDIFVHGGEPLLAGLEYFRVLVDAADEFFGKGIISFGVQTNATLIDDDWIDFFRDHNFSVGVSLDGDAKINDQHRVFPNGTGTFDTVADKIRKLVSQVQKVGVTAVATRHTMGQPDSAGRIYETVVGLGLRNIDVHPALTLHEVAGDAADDNPTATEYANFMSSFLNVWSAGRVANTRVRFIDDILENLSAMPSATCYSSGRCTQILGVEANGVVSPCTRPFEHHSNLGNLIGSDLLAIEGGAEHQKFMVMEADGRHAVRNCKWSSLCGGGNCPHERVSDGRQHLGGRHLFCTCESAAEEGFPAVFRALGELLVELDNRIGV